MAFNAAKLEQELHQFIGTEHYYNRKETLVVSWMVVPNSKVQATCETISKDSGLGGFGFAVDACSFWRKDTCLIVTGSQTTHSELGHELRHCYQGSFH